MSEVRDTRLRKAGVFFMYILSKNLSNTWDGPFVTSLVLTGLDSSTGTAYSKTVLAALKELRGWFFVLTFLSIGLTTRLRDLTKVGYKPLLAFAIGVAINVPLGYLLSTQVFQNFWLQL